jgi:hypothetical protein
VSQQADSAIRRDIDGGSVRSMDQYWEGNDLRTGIDSERTTGYSDLTVVNRRGC